MNKPRQSLCRGCGKPILWGTEEGTGRRLPLDPTPPVYEVQGFYDGGDTGEGQDIGVTAVRRHFKAYVSHFATCPKANEFSGSKKRPA